MFLWLKKISKEIGAFAGAILYLFSPYHLIDLHFRADIGEILAFVFLPLIVLTATNMIQTKKSYWLVIEAISIAFLILSHPAVALIGLIIVYIYIFLLIQHYPEKLLNFSLQLFAFFCGVLLTGFYIIPVLYELHFTLQAFRQEVSFVRLPELLYAPWRYGLLFQGPKGQLAVFIGYIQSFIILLAFLFLWKRKIKSSDKQFIILSLVIIFVLVFMMLEISKPLWYLIPFIKSFQFSYRLMGVMMFVISILGAFTVSYINRRWIIIAICFLAIFSTILNWGNRKNIPNDTDTILRQEIPFTATNGGGLIQAVTRWSDPKHPFARTIPKQHMQLLKGDGTITQLSYTLTNHVYLVDMKTNTVVRENTLFFPGWIAYVDNKKVSTQVLTSSIPKGIISFPVSKGEHNIAVHFENTFAMNLGRTISILSAVLLLIYSFGNRYRMRFV